MVANWPPAQGQRRPDEAVAAGGGDVAIVNTYYVLLVNSEAPEERAVGEQLGVFFPDQDGQRPRQRERRRVTATPSTATTQSSCSSSW